jgi:hypothetical protein
MVLIISVMIGLFYSLLSSSAKQCKAAREYIADHKSAALRFVSWQDYSIRSKVYSTVSKMVLVYRGEKGRGVFFINCQRYEVSLDSLLAPRSRGLLVDRNGRVSIVQAPALIVAPQ